MWTCTREKKKRVAKHKGNDACNRYMTEAGLKEDNATTRAQWRKKIPATPDDGASQGRSRSIQCHVLSRFMGITFGSCLHSERFESNLGISRRLV